MSLRARLLAVIVLAMLVSFGAGAALSTWHDARMVRDEVAAALVTGRQDAALAVASSAGQPLQAELLRHFVASFDGSRHVSVELLDAAGHVVAVSRLHGPKLAPPNWFAAMIAPRVQPVFIPLPGSAGLGGMRLLPEPASEIGERWTETRDRLTLLGLLSFLTGLLCSLTLNQGLAPLRILASGLDRLGAGERRLQLPLVGPPEIAGLAEACNRLAGLLDASEQQNLRLQDQLQLVAEEERLDIARDLHDEVGPLLFAITTHAATIGRLAEAGIVRDIPPQLQAIRSSVSILQDGVRAMLHRLRDAPAEPPDLEAALQELIGFWRQLRPDTRFELMLPHVLPRLEPSRHIALLRVAQEGISNAIRHATARSIGVELRCNNSEVIMRVCDDGTGGVEGSGYGLPGLRERLSACGGRLEVASGPGWTLTATAPRL